MQIQALHKQLDEINIKLIEIKDEINSIDRAVTSNDVSKLFSTTFDVDKYRQLPHKIVLYSPTFTQGKINGEQLSELFGTLSLTSLSPEKKDYSIKTSQKLHEAGSSSPVKQLLDEPETVTTINTGYEYLYNVACLSDEEIWTSGDDSTMKLFSINQGSLLKSITTRSGTTHSSIAVTKSGDLVYTDYNDRTVNIVKIEKIYVEEMIRLQDWKPRAAYSTSLDDLLVIMENDAYKQTKVVRYSGSTQKQSIQFDDKGKPLLSYGRFLIYYIRENTNQDICLSDCGAGAVVVVNQVGKLRFRYTGHTPALKNLPFSPLGITTDSQSHILTVDFNNDCVHIIDRDGQFLRYIECGLSKPRGLCTDTNDNLLVAQYGNRQVKKIRYLH
ncbi:uncharacterized protein LOC134283263 [Saccostrea cucullata]|uniref:uncharacterized protein LOC134283263 n=1 Tax=Saccostrea cuccullata TaxID=36930 RepID=UPI002ED12CE6